ncbi:uncharacterized protein LOC131892290 [Tigriopus californicus]|uniref:uncharacterized protein LOC131892290 n=1 Tax=Tigriopus californicus TaxID=6832 RepID=UPI0027DAA4BA|nr:uncharacterized protein LOC131892290 [Tigriopus californicus]
MAKLSHIMAQALLNVWVTYSNCLVMENTSFRKYPGKCTHSWESANRGLRKPLLEAIGMCFPGNDCDGVRCDPTMKQCEHRISSNDTNSCSYYYNGDRDDIFLNQESISNNFELFIAVLEEGKMWSMENFEREPLLFPPLLGDYLTVEYEGRLLACACVKKQCLTWSNGGDNWEPFPSLQMTHLRGAFLLLNGQPIIIGGQYHHLNGTIQNHGVVEIFNGTMWTRGPEFPSPTLYGVMYYINETTLGITNLESPFFLFILNGESMVWRQLPIPGGHRYPFMSCNVFQRIIPDHLFCYNMRTGQDAIIDLNAPHHETIVSDNRVPIKPPGLIGRFHLKENILFHYPITWPSKFSSAIFSIDLTEMAVGWKRVDNFDVGFFNRPNTLFNVKSFVFHRP